MSTRRRWLLWTLVVLALALLLAGHLRVDALLADLMAAPNGGRLVVEPPPPEVDRVIRVEVGPPKAVLEAWVYEPEPGVPPGPLDVILCLHGIGDKKGTMRALGPRFSKRGTRTVLVDLRGHGASTGEHITYGALEARDLSQLLDFLASAGLLDGPVGVYGPSYGGVVALQLAGRDPRIAAVVTSGAFGFYEEMALPRVKGENRFGWLLPDFVAELLLRVTAWRAGFSVDDVDVLGAVGSSRARMLLVHGAEDTIVPPSHARAMKERCGERCELLMLDGVDHLESLSNQPLRSGMNALFFDPALGS